MWLCWGSSALCVFTFAVTFSCTSSTASSRVLPDRWSSRVMFLNCETQRLKIVTSNLVWAYLDDERMTFRTKWDSALISGRKQPYHSYGALVNTCKLHQYNQNYPTDVGSQGQNAHNTDPLAWQLNKVMDFTCQVFLWRYRGFTFATVGAGHTFALMWLICCFWSSLSKSTATKVLLIWDEKRRKEEFEGDEIRKWKTKTKIIKELNCGEKTFDLY